MLLILGLILFLSLTSPAASFDSGKIADTLSISGQNFRHGDLEGSLQKIQLSLPATSRLSRLLRSQQKISDLDIKRIYFGNWLRDFNQVFDAGVLRTGVNQDFLRYIIGSMAYVEFGYATNEFDVSSSRLGVYRPEEHIDNPEGYSAGTNATTIDKRLRGPVSAEEIAIDHKTGMKNYIANESGSWSTSADFVRKSITSSISNGRTATKNMDQNALYEAERLLGQALHTLEDFTAHTNYCELVLIDMNYTDVFPHVGSNTKVNAGERKGLYPLVTGSFGSADFIHSFLGAAQDSLDQSISSLHGLESRLNATIGTSKESAEKLKWYLGMLPPSTQLLIQTSMSSLSSSSGISFSSSTKLQDNSDPSTAAKQAVDQFIAFLQGHTVPQVKANSGITTDEARQYLTPIFRFHDTVMRAVDESLDVNNPVVKHFHTTLSQSLNSFTLSMAQPTLTPILECLRVSFLKASMLFAEGDATQWAVWGNATSTTPTHSQLAKDHFDIHLNEPAGRIAMTVVQYITPMIIKAWDDESVDANQVVETILETFHHPALASTKLQLQMRKTMEDWVNGLPNKDEVMKTLTSCSVRNGHNHKDNPGSSEGNSNCRKAAN